MLPHRKLGNTTLIREEIYRQNSLPVLDTLARHLRYAFRQLRRSPVFAIAAILSLALGIGATTAIFTLIDRIVLRPLPVTDPGALVALSYREHPGAFNQGSGRFSWPLYRAIRDENTVLKAFGRFRLSLSVGEKDWTDRVEGELVTGNYFEILGIQGRPRQDLHRVGRPDHRRTSARRPQLRLLDGPVRLRLGYRRTHDPDKRPAIDRPRRERARLRWHRTRIPSEDPHPGHDEARE
jgi:hypothetical protein